MTLIPPDVTTSNKVIQERSLNLDLPFGYGNLWIGHDHVKL